MYDDDDFGLAELRALALAFPEAIEKEAFGRPTFRAGEKGKVFSYFGQGQSGHPRPFSVLVLLEEAEREALLTEERCYLPSYLAPAGWLGIDLTITTPDWQEIAELLDSSYRRVASKSLITRLDTEGGPADQR